LEGGDRNRKEVNNQEKTSRLEGNNVGGHARDGAQRCLVKKKPEKKNGGFKKGGEGKSGMKLKCLTDQAKEGGERDSGVIKKKGGNALKSLNQRKRNETKKFAPASEDMGG